MGAVVVILAIAWLCSAALSATYHCKKMSPEEKRKMLVQEIIQCMDYDTALEIQRKIKVSFDQMNVLEEAAVRYAGTDEEFRGTFHLTREMATKIAEISFYGLELEKFNPWLPGVDIYCGKTATCGLIVLIENDWKTKDGMIKMTISDVAGGQDIVQTFDAQSLVRCFLR